MSALFIREECGSYVPANPEAVRQAAMRIAEERMRRDAYEFAHPSATRDWLIARFTGVDREEFVALWVDCKNQLIEAETLSTGTINAANVYSREVVKSAIRCGAAGVIFAHMHPNSGEPEPSMADKRLTERLAAALALIDVRALDHVVIGGARAISFAERGWL